MYYIFWCELNTKTGFKTMYHVGLIDYEMSQEQRFHLAAGPFSSYDEAVREKVWQQLASDDQWALLHSA